MTTVKRVLKWIVLVVLVWIGMSTVIGLLIPFPFSFPFAIATTLLILIAIRRREKRHDAAAKATQQPHDWI